MSLKEALRKIPRSIQNHGQTRVILLQDKTARPLTGYPSSVPCFSTGTNLDEPNSKPYQSLSPPIELNRTLKFEVA